MTLLKMLKKTNIENIKEGEFEHEVEPPYICFLDTSPRQYAADGINVFETEVYTIEVYAEKKDKDIVCKNIEDVFKEHRLTYSKGVFWIGGNQQTYEIIYAIRKKEDY